MNRLQYFDWGGSFGNSLEKNIVNNYVKKIQSYTQINEEIEKRFQEGVKLLGNENESVRLGGIYIHH